MKHILGMAIATAFILHGLGVHAAQTNTHWAKIHGKMSAKLLWAHELAQKLTLGAKPVELGRYEKSRSTPTSDGKGYHKLVETNVLRAVPRIGVLISTEQTVEGAYRHVDNRSLEHRAIQLPGVKGPTGQVNIRGQLLRLGVNMDMGAVARALRIKELSQVDVLNAGLIALEKQVDHEERAMN